jgi:hypothetical protein
MAYLHISPGKRGDRGVVRPVEAVPKLQLWKTSKACQATLNLGEKPGRTLVRFDRFFQELVQNQPGFGTSSVICLFTGEVL